jgi:hypothetical protein
MRGTGKTPKRYRTKVAISAAAATLANDGAQDNEK